MREKLTPEERETIILTSDADDTFEIYTFDSGLTAALRYMSEIDPQHYRLRKESQDIGCVTFDVFRPCLGIELTTGTGIKECVRFRTLQVIPDGMDVSVENGTDG